MSRAEHIDIASAQSSGLNDSENDGGSLNHGDVGKCFGEGLEQILNKGKELGMLDNEVQICDTFSMEIGASNCDGLTSTNTASEHDGEGPSSEATKDGMGTSTFGNVKTMRHCSSSKELHVDVGRSCYEALEDHKAASTCQNELYPVENSDFNVVGGQALGMDSAAQAEEYASLMQAPIGGSAFGNESQACEHLDVDRAACQESDANVILPDIIVGSELVSEGLFIENDAADIPIGLNKESQTCEPLTIQDPNIVSPNIVGSELVSEGLVTKNDPVNLPSEFNIQNGSSDIGVECGQDVQLEQKEDVASEAALASFKDNQDTELNLNHGGQKCLVEESEKSHHGMCMDAKDCLNDQQGPLSEEITEKQYVVVLATPATYEMSRRGRRPGKFISAQKKCTLRSSVDKVEASQPKTNLENSKGSTGKRRGRKKKSEIEGQPHDEFERMRKHLRYLLHRIRYAQNLLDAYSSEGWRGQSLEKLRPEKELQRAKADITRSKLKIRDLFQRLDSISAQGKFPESLYDSDGLIDSEDIFCAKCGSKDLSTTNDIILCDGVCERGFHQYCLEPPLRTEDIPPGDEGWLCPACECKLDCLNLLNDSQGVKLSIKDNWEKVFPETAALTVGKEHDDITGLPSDDSEDNDFNPDGSDDDDANDEGSGDSSSDESDSSDFSSASEDLGAITGNHQSLTLPSDDSEDDDYDPDASNVNEDAKHETSSSGFASASENLGPTDDDGEISGNPASELPLSEVDRDMGDIPSVSGRRHVQRLDYKKLYDETYGNATSDSSDDEEWADVDTTMKGRHSKKGGSVSSAADASALADNSSSVATTPKKRGRKKKLNPSVANDSPAQPTENFQKAGSSSKSSRRPPYNKLGETVVQRLYESFKENQYPDREMREKLADELGLTPDKVNKWFGHARWTFNHHRDRIEGSMSRCKAKRNETNSTATDVATTGSDSGNTNLTKMDTKETDKKASVSRRGRKRKKTEDDQPNVQSSNSEVPVVGSTQEAQQGVEKRLNNIGAS